MPMSIWGPSVSDSSFKRETGYRPEPCQEFMARVSLANPDNLHPTSHSMRVYAVPYKFVEVCM